MTRKLTFLILALFALISGPGWGQTTTTTTYTFNSKSWEAIIGETAANWTPIKDGNQFTANQGIQVSKNTSGACGSLIQSHHILLHNPIPSRKMIHYPIILTAVP